MQGKKLTPEYVKSQYEYYINLARRHRGQQGHHDSYMFFKGCATSLGDLLDYDIDKINNDIEDPEI